MRLPERFRSYFGKYYDDDESTTTPNDPDFDDEHDDYGAARLRPEGFDADGYRSTPARPAAARRAAAPEHSRTNYPTDEVHPERPPRSSASGSG
ncbi:hypothetical protein GS931_18315 [Rhodococcus hoagii]|nr:hypothetical protein [Prescottella equi]